MKSSLSARRAWIENLLLALLHNQFQVALRKESVDRKTDKRHPEVLELGRSPQGERG